MCWDIGKVCAGMLGRVVLGTVGLMTFRRIQKLFNPLGSGGFLTGAFCGVASGGSVWCDSRVQIGLYVVVRAVCNVWQ